MKGDLINKFLKSALTEENPYINTNDVKEWILIKNSEVNVHVEEIEFNNLKSWKFTENKKIEHVTGKFFTIEGINVRTDWRGENEWDQPIINQPEIGILGIITKEINGILYFLLQAKIEPGNINNVQLSPTLQATKSNYTQVHGGNKPAYLEYFLDRTKNLTLLDQLQSEQGARFLKKRNRNIIIQVYDDLPILDEFVWLTLGQIKKLILFDNLVNMDTRTVISGISYKTISEIGLFDYSKSTINESFLISSINTGISLYSFEELVAWLTELKCRYSLKVSPKSLNNVRNWIITDRLIYHENKRFFSVIAARITISNREVSSWCQPLIKPSNEGIIAFISKKIFGVLHFLVQAKLECGNFDILELAPTVQCLTGDYKQPDYDIPYLDYVLNASKDSIMYDAMQSEEGGRFYKEQNRNIIIEVGDEFSMNVPDNYTWMTLSQLNTFITFNNYLNIQSRSLLAAINFIF